MSSIHLRNVEKRFGDSVAVKNISLSVAQGEFVSLLGPSGCGKTTTLRMIAGFIAPTSGEILFDDQSITRLAPYQRDIGMVFQSLALFPHRNVRDNVGYGLKMRGHGAAAIRDKVDEMLELVRLTGFAERFPNELSGGQRQRVAFARALAFGPKILLLDEPFAALDRKLREEMQVELRRLHEQLRITTVFVTHDQREAFTLSDRIAVVNQGRIEQFATANDIYYRPATRFIAEFVGVANLLEATVQGADRESARVGLPGTDTTLSVPLRGATIAPAGPAHLFVRPEFVTLEPDDHGDEDDGLRGTVTLVRFMGELLEAHVQTPGGQEVIATYQGVNAPALSRGQPVRIHLPPEHSHLLHAGA